MAIELEGESLFAWPSVEELSLPLPLLLLFSLYILLIDYMLIADSMTYQITYTKIY